MPTRVALAITLGVVAAVATLVGLGVWLHLQPLHVGFFVLWFWTAAGDSRLEDLERAVIGSCGGAANSLLVQQAFHGGGPGMVATALALTVIALFLTVAGIFPALFNPSYMLFLVVLNPLFLGVDNDFSTVIGAVVLGIVWFGASAWIVRGYVNRRQGPDW